MALGAKSTISTITATEIFKKIWKLVYVDVDNILEWKKK